MCDLSKTLELTLTSIFICESWL